MDKTAHSAASRMGIYAVDIDTCEVIYAGDSIREIFPDMRVGEPCYRVYGRSARCPGCPLTQLRDSPFVIGYSKNPQSGENVDVLSIRFQNSSGRPAALVCCGRISLSEKRRWLEDERYQIILMQTHTILFNFDFASGDSFVSPSVGLCLQGNYDDGRILSDVLIEDNVIHPQDLERFRAFRAQAHERSGEWHDAFRFLGREGRYKWYKVFACTVLDGGEDKMLFGTITDANEEMELRESLRRRAEYDATTGIYNKEKFLQRTQELLAGHPDASFAIVRFDVERFKTVNELFSLEEGDAVLRFIGGTLRELTEENEAYGRLDNDVFCLCLARGDEETVRLVETVNERLDAYPLDFNFILSAGIYRVPRYKGEPVRTLIDRATLAQRSVKGNYVQRCRFYEDWMGQQLSKEHYLIGGMRRALEERQFIIYLQPKYDMESGRIFGAEALVRWQHPRDGMLPPGEFIPLFERNGFVLRLDEYVWDLACATLRRWLDEGIEPVPVSVNVSRKHLHDTALCDKVLSLIEKYRLPPRLLELEITESAYTENQQSLESIMERLQREGFAFSMDDFGSGYSSLNMLKDIPVDILKIDLNFLTESKRKKTAGRTILEATIQMARRLELPVVAEGVETAEQADFLLGAGCTRAQGYYFGRPMPVDEFERLLKSQAPVRA